MTLPKPMSGGPPIPVESAKTTQGRGRFRLPTREMLREHLRKQLRALVEEHASPERLGVAIGVGVLVGTSPFLGVQVLLALGLAWLFRLNKMAVMLGVQVSIPPITPLILFLNAQVGAWLLRGHFLPLSLEAMKQQPAAQVAAELFRDLLVGGLVVGGCLAVVLGRLTTGFVRRRRRHQGTRVMQDHRSATAPLTLLEPRLRALPRRFREYGRWKLKLDPVYPMVLEALPGDVELLDLGTGMGLLPALVRLRHPQSSVRAVEWDEKKVAVARQLLSGLERVELEQGDARQVQLGTPGALTLLDVLHYSPHSEQEAWLRRCARALRPGGVLVVRELEPRGSTKAGGSWATWLERMAVRLRWNRGAAVHPWSPSEMAKLLAEEGFTSELYPAGKGLFRANTLLVARKQA